MTPFFSWLASLATNLQKPAVIVAATSLAAAFVSALTPKIRYTARATGVVLLAIGALILAVGLLLVYAKIWAHTTRVPLSALRWMPATGIALLVTAWILRWQRRRAARNRIRSLADVVGVHIRALNHQFGATTFVDETTADGEPVVFRLMSLVRRPGRGRRIILVGDLGSGKTASLLKFAMDCLSQRSARTRPLIALYVDLAQYAAQPMGAMQLNEFILSQFIEPARTDVAEGMGRVGS